MLPYYIDVEGRLFIGDSENLRSVTCLPNSRDPYTLIENIPPLLKIIPGGDRIFFLSQEGRIGYLTRSIAYFELSDVKNIIKRTNWILAHTNQGEVFNININTGEITSSLSNIKQISEYSSSRTIMIDNQGLEFMIGFDTNQIDIPEVNYYQNGLLYSDNEIFPNPFTTGSISSENILSATYYGLVSAIHPRGTLIINSNREIKFIDEKFSEKKLVTYIIPNRFLNICNKIQVIEDINGNLYKYVIYENGSKISLIKLEIPRLIEQKGINFKRLKAAK